MSGPRPAGTPSGAPAGYSGTPLHRKLGVKPGHRVLAVGVPPGFPLALLDPDATADVASLPHVPGPTDGAAVPPADVVLAFAPDAATLAASLPALLGATAERGGRCWICWPKRSSGVATDLTEDAVREAGLAAGWVDVKVCAVDAVWSGLCLMRRTRSAPR